jgi:hypothetical protein
MLTQRSTFRIYNDGTVRDIVITPLFLQNHKEPWQPNEIFDLSESAEAETSDEPVTLGKIIINDSREWRWDGDGGLADDELKQIVQFVLDSQ